MSKSTAPVVPATASEVRDFVLPLTLSGEVALSTAAAHNLTSRGRLHPEVVEAHNSRVTRARRYVEGAKRTITLDYKRVTASGSRTKTAALPEAEVRALAGALAGKRGPLSAKALAAASEAYAAKVNA